MDRRQKKSREAIFTSFRTLLERRSYNKITVQDIIDMANVGRSTFYAHFNTKEDLLDEMCTEIFDHIFSDKLTTEATHDFSMADNGLKEELTHLLYHLRDSRGNVAELFKGDNNEEFMKYFRKYTSNLFLRHIDLFNKDIPKDFLLYYLTGSFTEVIRWWISDEMSETPHVVLSYFFRLNNIG